MADKKEEQAEVSLVEDLKEEEKEEKKEFKSIKNYKLVLQAYNQSVEEIYFWFIGWFKDDLRDDVVKIEKLTDVFSAAESSSYFGSSQVRIGAQQEKASQYIRGINEMSKQLFQIVREIRILNERLSYYETSMSDDEDAQANEITLKGIYIDLVEGAGKNPSSVYGLAQQLGFTLLPDLFFRAKVNVHKNESIHRVVSEKYGSFNEKVKEVLERKLTQYYSWKMATYKELKHTRKFRIKYLKSYYYSIKMYLQWVKPYLKHIKRLSMDENRMDTADMVAGMEQAMMEIDLLVHLKRNEDKGERFNRIIHMNFLYRTAPEMLFQEKDTYQKGPIHVGRVEVTFKGYVLSDKDLKEFKDQKDREDMELLGSINDSINETLDSLGDDLQKYLKDEGEDVEKKKEKKEKEEKLSIFHKSIQSLFGKPKDQKKSDVKNTLEIFYLPFKGLGELIDSLTGLSRLGVPKSEEKRDTWKDDKELSEAKGKVKTFMWLTYNIFKKAHAMITW